MIVKTAFPRKWTSLKQLMWLFGTAIGGASRDPASDVVNIGRVDYMTLNS